MELVVSIIGIIVLGAVAMIIIVGAMWLVIQIFKDLEED